MSEASNETLLARYRNADIKAFEIFYSRNKNIIYNFLYTKLGRQELVDEAFQETFISVHRHIVKYDPKQSAMSWVFSIARNAAIDVYRKINKFEDHIESIQGYSDDLSGAEETVTAREELLQLLQSLPLEEQQLIKSRYLDGQSYQEIAQQLRQSPANVRQRFSRLLRKIRGQVRRV